MLQMEIHHTVADLVSLRAKKNPFKCGGLSTFRFPCRNNRVYVLKKQNGWQ